MRTGFGWVRNYVLTTTDLLGVCVGQQLFTSYPPHWEDWGETGREGGLNRLEGSREKERGKMEG